MRTPTIRVHVSTESASDIPPVSDHHGLIFDFPEVRGGVPRTPREILEWCDHTLEVNFNDGCGDGVCDDIVIRTTSEHLCLWILRQVSDTSEGANPLIHLSPSSVEFVQHHKGESRTLRIDETSEFLDRWTDGFFTERAELLF